MALVWHTILDSTWDFFHRTETLARIRPEDLVTDSANKGQATWYGATRARPLEKLLRRLDLPRDTGFVDLGAGKGRVVILAASYGFRKIVGIDFSEPLCQAARQNIESFRRGRSMDSEITIVHSDVVLYPFKPDESVFFLYDPFSASVLEQVLVNLRRSVEKSPREIWMIYNAPRQHQAMERSGLFSYCQPHEIGGIEFCVYGNGAPRTSAPSVKINRP